MVIDKKKHSDKPRLNQGSSAAIAEPNKIAASTHFDFQGKNLTPYGGLFPVATMLERLGFEKLVNETLTVTRIPRVMTIYQFVLGMVLAIYVGIARLNHLRFVAQDPMLTGILQGEQAAGAERVLAVSGLAESEPGRATVATAAHSARTGVGSGPRRADVDHAGHRYHRAYALWPADGGPQEL